MAQLPLGKLYNACIFYNCCSRRSRTEDQQLSLDLVEELVEFLERPPNSYKCYYEDRDLRLGKDIFNELDMLIKGSDWIIVILTKGFIQKGWHTFSQKVAFKKHLDNGSDKFLPIAVGIDEHELPTNLPINTVLYTDRDWRRNVEQLKRKIIQTMETTPITDTEPPLQHLELADSFRSTDENTTSTNVQEANPQFDTLYRRADSYRIAVESTPSPHVQEASPQSDILPTAPAPIARPVSSDGSVQDEYEDIGNDLETLLIHSDTDIEEDHGQSESDETTPKTIRELGDGAVSENSGVEPSAESVRSNDVLEDNEQKSDPSEEEAAVNQDTHKEEGNTWAPILKKALLISLDLLRQPEMPLLK
ncbi:hypothetical protein ScPMuIL_005614 [Solemya velum]